MHQTKKGNQWYFGMKAHIGVDADSGLVHTVATTPANEADVEVVHELLHGKEQVVHADSGYTGADKRVQRKKLEWQIAAKRMVLVTGHRRENFDGGLERVFKALAALARRGDVQVVFPVHLNPKVQEAANTILDGIGNVHLIAPQPYRDFVWLMAQSHLIVTDSGGIQEEAPGLGKPVLVTRDTKERPEAVHAGTVELIGTDGAKLLERTTALLDDSGQYERMSRAINPYGDGLAAGRIVRSLINAAVS
jgi:UDP-N-acetylglucosamine 2-epimerase